MTEPTDRQKTIAGLRELADFLEAHPDVPISSYLSLQYSVDSTLKSQGRTSYADRRAEVERVAGVLGVEASTTGPRYLAERRFGGVTYVAASCDPGPKPGYCINHPDSPAHRPGSELIDGQVCTTCLTPSIAAAFDVAHELTDRPADTTKES
jgi:hypothetical protein